MKYIAVLLTMLLMACTESGVPTSPSNDSSSREFIFFDVKLPFDLSGLQFFEYDLTVRIDGVAQPGLINGDGSRSYRVDFSERESLMSFDWTAPNSFLFLMRASKFVSLSSPVNVNDSEYRIDFDDDFDGVTNLDEMLNGTDPLDAQSN